MCFINYGLKNTHTYLSCSFLIKQWVSFDIIWNIVCCKIFWSLCWVQTEDDITACISSSVKDQMINKELERKIGWTRCSLKRGIWSTRLCTTVICLFLFWHGNSKQWARCNYLESQLSDFQTIVDIFLF